MQQAIEEGFILDVLQNYTSYKVAYRIGSQLVDDKRVDEKSARRKLAKWLSLNPVNVGQKVELIVEHFRRNVAHLLGGQAKAMVVTSSRAAAVKYHLALQDYCRRKRYDNVQAMVAFSGDVPNADNDLQVLLSDQFPPDHQFSETNLNPGLHGRDMRKVFDTPDYRVMIVANKYQTGFDQPKLVAMYLDKRISGVEAVQTLSRLNRTFPGKDKTYVIDFANEAEEILAAFKTFYRDAQVADIQDPNIVYDIKQRLDGMFIYEQAEVDTFAVAIVDPATKHEKLYSLTQPATDRFNGKLKILNDAIDQWEKAWTAASDGGDDKSMEYADAQRAEYCKKRDELMIFRESLGKFVRTYEYIAQLVDFGDPDLEAFAAFARLLSKRLKGLSAEQVDLGDLRLSHYRLKNDAGLVGVAVQAEVPGLYGITDNGLREARDREKEYLSTLIAKLNDAFGQGITDTDQVALAVHVSEKLRADSVVMAQVQNNPLDQAMKADLPGKAIQAIAGAMSSHQVMATKLLSDEATRDVFLAVVYELLRRDAGASLLESVR